MNEKWRDTRELGIDEVDDEADHHLFLFRVTLSDQEGKGYESTLIDLHVTISPEAVTVFFQKPYEEEGSNSLVPITEGMILDDEIEKVRRLLLYRRIEICTIESRDDRREDTCEALILLISE